MRGPSTWTNNSIEEELYEKAHIDYNRVAIVRPTTTGKGQLLPQS